MLRFKNGISLHCILAAVYFLMLPLTIATNSAGASFLKVASLPIGLYFIVSLLFYKQEFQINMVHITLALFTLGTAVTLFVANDYASIAMVLGYFLNAALYISLSVVIYNEKEIKILEDVQIVLLIIVTALTLFDNVTGEANRETLTILGQASDPNYFVGYFIFPLSVAMKRIFESKWRLGYAALCLVALYAVFLSGSRGGMLAILVTVFAFALIYPKGLGKKIVVMATLFGGIILLWLVLQPVLPQHIVERMSVDAVLETRGTYRADIWESMIDEIKDSDWEVLIGRGIDSTHYMMIMGKQTAVFAHNYFIQLMYNQGVIGFVLFFLLLITAVGRNVRRRKYVSVALIGMMALVVSLSVNPSMKTLWNIIPYAAFAYAGSNIKEKEEGSVMNEN